MNKQTAAFATALLISSSLSGCGKTESQAGTDSAYTETTTATTAAVTTTETGSDEDTTTSEKSGSSSGSGFGMMGYVNKSRLATARCNAKSIFIAFTAYMTDKRLLSENKLIYSNTAEEELAECVKGCTYDDKNYDFIILFDDNGNPDAALVPYYEKNRYVGCYGTNGLNDEYDSMKWNEVLEKYGLTAGEYTDISFKDNPVADDTGSFANNYTDIEGTDGLDLDDPDMFDSCVLATAIFLESENGDPADYEYVYGKWDKDTPFSAAANDEIPEHGDIEYILEFSGNTVWNVFCRDCGRDKKYVGDANGGYYKLNFVGKTWDDVLEHYGFTQGEYVKYR